VVTALHHINQGRAWPEEEMLACKRRIKAASLVWPMVESIAAAGDVKTRTGWF
jgi:mannonate dehydratase